MQPRRRNTTPTTTPCMYFARVAAVVLVLLGLAGSVDILGWALPAGIFHLGVGLLFTYPGFLKDDGDATCWMVGGLGVLLLVVKVPTIVAPLLWGQALLLGPIEVSCLAVGILSVLAARYLPDEMPGSRGE